MASKKKARARKRPAAKKKRAARKAPVKRGKSRSRSGSISKAKSRIRKDAEDRLRDGLFARDRAKSRKQHNVAKRKIDAARTDLRRYQ